MAGIQKRGKIRGEKRSSFDQLKGGEARRSCWDAWRRNEEGRWAEGRGTAGTTEPRLKSTKNSRWAESGRDASQNNSAGCEGHTFK